MRQGLLLLIFKASQRLDDLFTGALLRATLWLDGKLGPDADPACDAERRAQVAAMAQWLGHIEKRLSRS